MNTIMVRGAMVTGARHLRIARNGQDAVATWAAGRAGAVVVCDGCGAGASSEVGARLGAQLVIGALARRLAAGDPAVAVWPAVRAEVLAALSGLAAALPGDPADRVRDHFLFTIVAAAVQGDEVSVWSVGDGAYAIDGTVRTLGPFADNQPPYLGYELLGASVPVHVDHATLASGTVVVATDGAAELDLAGLVAGPLDNPDGLRRRLAVLARGSERIDWDARRVVRTPALLQDDGAVAVMRWQA